jgi:hypothetical protein
MNTKEIGEIRRHLRRDRSNMTAIYGCYVNDQQQIITTFRQSLGMMPENEAEKYFSFLRRGLSGTIGKNLIDLSFRTAQVADSPEHKLLMDLRQTALKDEDILIRFYQKIVDSVKLNESYVILIGCDSYDVPFKSKDDTNQKDASDEVYTYLICTVCPVRQTKAVLHYVPEEKNFHDGGITNMIAAPELGFLFPAFDQRSTNIYNALYYCKNIKENHPAFVEALFQTPLPKPAAEQKKSFEDLLTSSLEDECSMDVVQTVHDQLCQRIALHKESKLPDALLIGKEDVQEVLESCSISESHLAKFSVDFDRVFGYEQDVHPKNIIDDKRFEVKLPDVSIKVAPNRTDLIETRVIGGVKYILIRAEEEVEVNGVQIQIHDQQTAPV